MSSPQRPENTQQPDGSGVGALLKASRLRIGEDLSEVSSILRIRSVYLEAIEDSRYDDLPGTTYAIGFIRAYADHLGLDSDEIVRRFKARTSGEESSPDLVFPEPISQAGIPGGAIVFVGALVAILAYGVWYVNTSEDGFLAELISPVPDRLAKLVPEEAKTEQAEPISEPVQKDPGQQTEPETQSAPPAEPEKTPRAAETPEIAATPEPEKAPEKVAEKEPQATPVPDPKPEAQTPAETEKKPAAEDSPEQQAAAWEPPPGVVKSPEPQSAPEPPAPQPAAETAPAPPEARSAPATASVAAPVTAAGSSPAAPETLTTQAPEPVNAPTVVPMDMIPPVPASPRPQAQAAAVAPEPVAPEASAPEAAAVASTPPPAPASEETPEVRSAAETPAREAPAATAAGGAGRIVVKAKANSWIQVRDDAAGELVLTRMLKSGDSYIVPDRSGLILSTGNAGALEILVDGEPVPAIGGEGTVRRKIVLDAERLKSGTAVRE